MTEPPRPRETSLDWARGVAVLSMVVAHTCPVGGIFNVSEYLTAPLFALLVGASMGLAWRSRRVGFRTFWAQQAARAVLLILIGLLLQRMYDQIWDVLIPLGLLTALLPPLVRLCAAHPRILGGITLGLLAATPSLVDRGAQLATGKSASSLLAFWTIGHPTYPLPLFLTSSLAGALLSISLAERRWPPDRL